MGVCSGTQKKPKQTVLQTQYEQKMKIALEQKQAQPTMNFVEIERRPVNEPLFSQNVQDDENRSKSKQAQLEGKNDPIETIQKQAPDSKSQMNNDDDFFDLDRPSNSDNDDSDNKLKHDQTITDGNQKKKKKMPKKAIPTGNNSDRDEDSFVSEMELGNPSDLKHLPVKGINVFRHTDYDCDITKIQILRQEYEGIQTYELIFKVKYQQTEHTVQIIGILKENINQVSLDLTPMDYETATQNSQIPCFFKDDNYFDATYRHEDNSIPFRYMMLVKRKLNNLKYFRFVRLERRTDIQGQAPTGIAQKQRFEHKESTDMLEVQNQFLFQIINVFDFQYQQNLKNILISKIIALSYPQFKDDVISMEHLLFVFESEPMLDMPQQANLCIFYKAVSYSLNSLFNFCSNESYMLDEDSVVYLAVKMISTLQKYYKANFYRLNFSLDTVYYSAASKNYKVNWYNRLRCLTALVPNTLTNLVKQRKLNYYIQAFQIDQLSIVDITLLFLTLRNQKITSQELHDLPAQKKLELIHSLRFKSGLEQLPKFLASCINSDMKTYEEVQDRLLHLKDIIKELEIPELKQKKDKFTLTMQDRIDRDLLLSKKKLLRENSMAPPKIDLEQKDEEASQSLSEFSMSEQSISDRSEEDDDGHQAQSPLKETTSLVDILPCMNILFKDVYNESGSCYGQRPELLPDEEMRYRSLYVDNLFKSYESENVLSQIRYLLALYVQQIKVNPQQEVMASRCVILLGLQDQYETKTKKAIPHKKHVVQEKNSYCKDMCKLLLKQKATAQDPIFYSAITRTIQMLIVNQEYDLLKVIINRLRSAITCQNEQKKELQNKISLGEKVRFLAYQDQEGGLIQVRKFVFVGLYQTMMEMSKKNFSQSSLIIQNMMKIQVAFHLEETVLYGFSVFLNGMINHEALAISTALLNYEISKGLYYVFFQGQHLVIANLNLKQGELNMIQKDHDNAVKNFKNAYELRQLYYAPIDDNVLEVLIKLLKGYIELDEVNSAMELCQQYMILAKKDKRFRNCKSVLYSQLQLVLACIYQSLGCFISSILCFQRSFKCLTKARQPNNLLLFYVAFKRKDCLIQMYNQALTHNNIIGHRREAIYSSSGFMSMNDVAKHCFSVASSVSMIPKNQRSSRLCIDMALANFQFHRKSYENSKAHYEACLKEAKNMKKDQKYGLILMKLAEIDLINKNPKDSVQKIQYAIEFFDLYMVIPQKQICIIKCYCYLSIAHVLLNNDQGYIDAFNEANKIKLIFEQKVRYSILTRINNAHAHLPNKYDILTRNYGHKFGYMMLDLFELIQQMMNFKKKLETAKAGKQTKSSKENYEKLALEFFHALHIKDKQQLLTLKKREAVQYGHHVRLTFDQTDPQVNRQKMLQEEKEKDQKVSKKVKDEKKDEKKVDKKNEKGLPQTTQSKKLLTSTSKQTPVVSQLKKPPQIPELATKKPKLEINTSHKQSTDTPEKTPRDHSIVEKTPREKQTPDNKKSSSTPRK